MDDCFINPYLLQHYDTSRIICTDEYRLWWHAAHNIPELEIFCPYSGKPGAWWWRDDKSGVLQSIVCYEIRIKKICHDKSIPVDRFSGQFSDFLYLPKKYLLDYTNLARLCVKNLVFHEIAIPTCARRMLRNHRDFLSARQFVRVLSLWDDRHIVQNEQTLHSIINCHLIVHPLKWSDQNPPSVK